MPEAQLPLAFPHRPLFTEAEFLPTRGNRLALEFLADPTSWPQRRLALWGGPGTGKTHLLHVWAARHGAAVLNAASLPETWPARPLALDDIGPAKAEPLLHLLNAASEAGHPVLLASREPPARLPLTLPDLASRLRATTAIEISAADEPFLATLLARLLAERQIPVAPSLQSWLLARLPRTPGAVRDAAARLDRAALAAGSAVTRTLAARELADLLHADGAADLAPPSPPATAFG